MKIIKRGNKEILALRRKNLFRFTCTNCIDILKNELVYSYFKSPKSNYALSYPLAEYWIIFIEFRMDVSLEGTIILKK